MIENTIKNLVPLILRDSLRPTYQKIRKTISNYKARKCLSIPESWKAQRIACSKLTTLKEFYEFSQKEFGLIQIDQEILSFLDYVQWHQPRIIGEIGLKNGGNSFLFLRALSGVKTVISMDIVLHNIAKLNYFSRDGQSFQWIEGDTHNNRIIRQLEKILQRQNFDLLFIDGDHSYKGVKQDFNSYARLVKKGGLIAFHDIVPDHATRYGKPQKGNCYAGGVHCLWAEIKNNYEHQEFVESWDQSGFGIGVIIKQ